MTVLRPLLPPETPAADDGTGQDAAVPAPPAADEHEHARLASGRRVMLAQFALSSFAVVLVLATIGTSASAASPRTRRLDDARS